MSKETERIRMVRVFLRHPVEDYGAWRVVYDDHDGMRRDMGVTGDGVYRAIDDPNDVTVWHDFEDAPSAETFVLSGELKLALTRAGVAAPPEIWTVEAV
jgi:hypothetical protein